MKKMLFFLLCTSLTDATGLSIPISIDSAISRLHFTGSANNITAVATNFLRLHPDLTSNTPISTIFDDLVSTMSIHATLAPGETFCHPVAADANYLPLAYTSRTEPFYYPIENAKSSILYQPHVYPLAAHLLRLHLRKHGGRAPGRIIDLGCGCGQRSAELHASGWNVVGVDFGRNIECARKIHGDSSGLTWLSLNLDRDMASDNRLSWRSAEATQRLVTLAAGAVIVSSDVIEHLMDPFALLSLVQRLLAAGAVSAVLSTPERDVIYGEDGAVPGEIWHPGPPSNDCHVREWNLHEFKAMLRCFPGLELVLSGVTQSSDLSPDEGTSVAVVRLDWGSGDESDDGSGDESDRGRARDGGRVVDSCGGIEMEPLAQYGSVACDLVYST
jgi:SAM-dependent methyltransferase